MLPDGRSAYRVRVEIIDRDRSGRERNGIIFRQIIGDNTGKRALVVADVHIVQSFAFAVCFKHLRVSEHLFGKPLLPIDSAQLEQWVTAGLTSAAAIWAWWENNSFTKEALAADSYLEQLKKGVH